MSVVVLGSGGQLGRDLCHVFGAGRAVRAYTHGELDVADVDAVTRCFSDARPALVLNAAAYTNVEGAEDDAAAAYRTNEAGARAVASAADAIGAVLVHFSTDFIFDGSKSTPYEPGDPIGPRGVYAASKAAGETAVRETASNHFIVRTAWLYGPGGNNFVEKILKAAAARPALRVVDDEAGSPTHTLDLARAAQALAATEAYGTYHAVNEGVCTRYTFAKSILECAGLDVSIEPCKASEYPSKAPRPAYSAMSNQKLKAACGFTMPDWETALREYMGRRENS